MPKSNKIEPAKESQPVPWTKASVRRPADGVDGRLLNIKPVKLFRPPAYGTYVALIYMGKHDSGLAWHWYEGGRSGWHTKISSDDWALIEYLDEVNPPK